MVRVGVLSHQKRSSYAPNDFYPLYRWKNSLARDGYKIRFFYEKPGTVPGVDLLLVHSRFDFGSKEEKQRFFTDLRNKGVRIVYFDGYDTSGIVDFDIIHLVDAFVKKQLLRDRQAYTENRKDISVRPWLSRMPDPPMYADYTPLNPEHGKKLKLAWNIGMCDYRKTQNYLYLYIGKYLPGDLKLRKKATKEFFLSFRGTLNYSSTNEISEQRTKFVEFLKSTSDKDIVLGGPVSYPKYVEELRKSQIAVSPFGWGEICYRDFETIISNTLLIKPDMSHLETYPDLFEAGETYVPILWNMSNLRETLEQVRGDQERVDRIKRNALRKFEYYHNSYAEFRKVFSGALE